MHMKVAMPVCNGSIYVRSGSSKEPIKPADRGNIEYLYERSKEYIKEIEDFRQRDYFIRITICFNEGNIPTINIYLKNISSKRDGFFNVHANEISSRLCKIKYKVFLNILVIQCDR